MTGPHNNEPWWKTGVIYQIYPRSFQDSNGDGIGDLKGIEQRLDYLQSLGVDAVWLSPIFPSPMSDFGYDVVDYVDVDPRFGTLADLDDLLAALHAKAMKLILDFVPNHSSSQHPWFLESRSSRHNPKRDWYIWRDPGPDGGPPNNWISDFGGSSWEWDETTGQFYLHAFLKEQPDLNWRNAELRAAMMDVLRFWMDRGVDGFRIDVLWHIIKKQGLPDNPINPDYRYGMGEMNTVLQTNSTDQPEVHDIAAEMRDLADCYDGDRVLIGEIYLPAPKLMTYYGTPDAPETQLPFNFQLINAPWDARELTRLIKDYDQGVPEWGWPNWVLGNHDRPRIADRVGEAQARVAAMLLLTLRGTPTVYYGDDLGIGRVDIPAEQVQDPAELRQPGIGLNRDPVRTPMAWDGGPNGGFTTGQPWLPLHPDWRARNVETEARDDASMLTLHRRLLALRRAHAPLQLGHMSMLEVEGEVLGFVRELDGERLLTALNLSASAQRFTLPDWAASGRVLVSTLVGKTDLDGAILSLRPNEGVVIAPSL